MTTIDIPLAAVEPAVAAEERAAQAAQAELRFLESIRRRVAWQVEQAVRLRSADDDAPLDLLDIGSLWQLVEAHPHEPRAREWRAFLAELREIADDDGRLPDFLERLVSVVFGELL